MAQPRRRGRSQTVTISLPTGMARQVRRIALAADRAGGVSAWVREAIRQRLRREAEAPAEGVTQDTPPAQMAGQSRQ